MNNSDQITQLQDQMYQLQEQIEQLKQTEAEPKLPTMIDIPDREYSMGETPVTVEQYKYYCEQTNQEMPTQPLPHCPTNPVVNVTLYDARNYALWLSESTGKCYRLPDEDEFEHCCADHKEANPDIAVYAQKRIQPVKTKKPNKYGLYDILGCVWEWQES